MDYGDSDWFLDMFGCLLMLGFMGIISVAILGGRDNVAMVKYTTADDIIEFEVTQEDIDGASKYSPYDCPIARAIHRTVEKNVGVGWLLAGIYWSYNERSIPYTHNYMARIKKFDATGEMLPFKGKLTKEYPYGR